MPMRSLIRYTDSLDAPTLTSNSTLPTSALKTLMSFMLGFLAIMTSLPKSTTCPQELNGVPNDNDDGSGNNDSDYHPDEDLMTVTVTVHLMTLTLTPPQYPNKTSKL